jgi:WD40 repeat protein
MTVQRGLLFNVNSHGMFQVSADLGDHDKYKYLGNNILASGGRDSTLKIWNLTTGECVNCFRTRTTSLGHKPVHCTGILHIDRNTVLYANSLGIHEVFDIYKGFLYNIDIPCFRDALCEIDSKRIAGGMLDKLTIVDLKSKTVIMALDGHKNQISVIAYLGKERVATDSADGTVKIWDLVTRTCTRTFGTTFMNGWGYYESTLVHVHGDLIASGSGYHGEDMVRIWNVVSGELVKVFHTGWEVRYLALVAPAANCPEWSLLMLKFEFDVMIFAS